MYQLNSEEIESVSGGVFAIAAVYAVQVAAIAITFIDEQGLRNG